MTPLTMTAEATPARENQDPRLTQLREEFGKLDAICDRIDLASRQIERAFSRGAQE